MRIAFLRRDPSFFGWLIQLWTRSAYSHCEVVWSDGAMISSMQGQGVRVTHMSQELLNLAWDVVETGCDAETEARVRKWTYSELGSGYDWYGLFFCQVLKMGREHPTEWFCSEFCTAALQQAGLCKNTKPYKQSPGSLYKLLTRSVPRV